MPEDWDAEWDDDETVEPNEFCFLGGPAPCMDDICRGLGGCMHTDDESPATRWCRAWWKRAHDEGDWKTLTLVLRREAKAVCEQIDNAGGEMLVVLQDGTKLTLGTVPDGEPTVRRIDR